jgi:hypothetical protein
MTNDDTPDETTYDNLASYAEWLERLNQAERAREDTIEWNE